MADPIDTTGVGAVFIGSHLKAEAFAGMNGDPNPSSLLPGQTVKRGSVGKSLMKGIEASANPGDWQTRNVSGGQGVKTNPGTKGAAKGGKVPSAVDRKAGGIRATR